MKKQNIFQKSTSQERVESIISEFLTPTHLSTNSTTGIAIMASQIVADTEAIKSTSASEENCKVLQKRKFSTDDGLERSTFCKRNRIDTSDPRSSSEQVFAIDHILEEILDSLDTSDLLGCRLVSTRWRLFTTATLQKRIEIVFKDYVAKSKAARQKPLFLTDLTELLQNTGKHGFPCMKFHFIKTKASKSIRNISDVILQNFLDTYGTNIKELSLTYSNFEDFEADSPPPPLEKDGMEQIKNLLLHQTPNLEFLYLQLSFQPETFRRSFRSSFDSILQSTSDPEFMRINKEVTDIPQLHLNTKLKVVQVESPDLQPETDLSLSQQQQQQRHGQGHDTGRGCRIPSKILEMIIQISSNLQEIILDKKSYTHFMRPLNRLHLLKKLEIKLEHFIPVTMYEEMLKMANNEAECSQEANGGKELKSLQLREIILSLEDNGDASISLECKRKTIQIVNRILACSSNSVESITWTGSACLEGMKWPKGMLLNVRKLTLGNLSQKDHCHHFFPPEFNFQEIFPKLEKLTLVVCNSSNANHSDSLGWVGIVSEFVNLLFEKAGDLPIMPSVKRLKIEGKDLLGRRSECENISEAASLTFLKLITKHFPNAVVTHHR